MKINKTKMNLYDDFLEEQIKISPSLNESLRLEKYKYLDNQQENPFSDYYITQMHEFHVTFLQKLKKIPKKELNIYDKFLIHICESGIEGDKYNFELIPISPLDNDIAFLVEAASGNGYYTFSDSDSYHVFLEKLSVFPEMCYAIKEKMRKGIELKYTLPQPATKKLVEQFDNLIKTKAYHNPDASKYFNDSVKTIVLEEIIELRDFIKNEYLPKCRKSIGWSGLPNGKAEYNYLVRNTVTSKNVSIEKIHQFGLLEIDRLRLLMENTMMEMDFKGSRHDFFKYIKNRKDLNFKSRKEVITEYKKMYKKIEKEIMPKLFKNKIKTKCEILEVPKYNEKYSPEAYYIEGDEDGESPGKFYINMRNIKENSKIEIESLTLHETIPGHHYHLSYLNEKKDIPLFSKIYGIEAYLEGWALYCENLGSYETPESYFGKLVLEMIRALRLVVDTGMHHYGWSYDKCFKYFKEYGFDSEEKIHVQLNRYMCLPSQALAYKMGEKCMIECLQKFKTDGGTDIKEFHAKVLEDGAVPLYLLKEKFEL